MVARQVEPHPWNWLTGGHFSGLPGSDLTVLLTGPAYRSGLQFGVLQASEPVWRSQLCPQAFHVRKRERREVRHF